MKKTYPLPSQTILLATFRYNKTKGTLYRKIAASKRNKRHVGPCSPVGKLWCCGRQHERHRIIWKMVHNEEPPEIDHIDLNRSNNKLRNLRPANSTTNAINRRLRSDNKSGAKGVFLQKNGIYKSGIRVNGRRLHIGCYRTLDEAKAAYAAAAAKYHGEYVRLE